MSSRRTALLVALGCLSTAVACHENDPAPWGDPKGGENNSGGIPDAGDDDTDTVDTDTGSEAVVCTADEVAQPDTGLCWLRCPVGQDLAGDDTCEGMVALFVLDDALSACALVGDGHHAATRQQMIELLEGCEPDVVDYLSEGMCDPCEGSDTCAQLFGFDPETYWTSTAGEFSWWAVSFDSGMVFMPGSELDLYAVRCVRHGR